MPLYLQQLKPTPPGEILAHRIAWSLVVMSLLLTFLGRWKDLQACLANPHQRRVLTLTSLLIGFNWFFYILSVDLGRVKEASLGYFITPMVNVLMGLIFFRERLRPLQWLALGLAFVGVVFQATLVAQFPWIAFALAGSFSLYGVLRKQLPVDGILGLSAETVCLTPLALGYLGYLAWTGDLVFARDWGRLEWLIPLSGIATAVPLVAFGQAARLLPLSTLGFFQFLSPCIQFAIAVAVFGEHFHTEEWYSFTIIWIALAVFTYDSARVFWSTRRPPLAA